MKYLIIFEDGTGKQYDDLPEAYQENVADGVIDILRFKDGQFQMIDADGNWQEVEAGHE